MELCSRISTIIFARKACTLYPLHKTPRKLSPLRFTRQNQNYAHAKPIKPSSPQLRLPTISVQCSQHSVSDNDDLEVMDDETVLLVRNAKEIISDLNGACLFFLGMSSSIKTDVARSMSEVLGYYLFDSDKLLEQASGGASEAWELKDQDEEGFRDSESEVLRQLSSMGHLVVSTGEGAVIRPANWQYMRNGITIWIDIPLEALAKKIVAEELVTQSHSGQTTAGSYSQALERLTELYEGRRNGYSMADVKVSVQKFAGESLCEDVFALKPAVIATEVVREIRKLLRYKKLQKAAAEPEIQKTSGV